MSLETKTALADVHAWLDGEIPVVNVRHADTARHVDFWTRIDADIARRRQVRTPPYLARLVIESLPDAGG